MDQRYQHIANYLTDTHWRKKEIVALTAEKSNKSDRTVRNWLDYLEKEGFIKTVQVSRNRVFVERNKERNLPFDFEIESESEVQSLLEKARQLIDVIIRDIQPSRSRGDFMPSSVLLASIRGIGHVFQNNTIPEEKLKNLVNIVRDLNKICRDQFVVISEDEHIECIFDILDDLIYLLEHGVDIEGTEDDSNYLTQTVNLTDMCQMYLSFLSEISLNAELVGYGKEYNSRLSERIHLLQPLVETVPDPVSAEIYYLIQSHATLSQRIDAFISKIQSQNGGSYNQFLTDVRSLYDDDERQRLRARLREIADELDGQQRTVVERLCVEINSHYNTPHDRNKIRYYNRTKEKIIAILSHGSEKLENIERYSKESKSNIHSNINKLSDDGYVDKVEDQHGCYQLDKETKELFDKRRRQTPVADREEVKKALSRMADRREEHIYPDGVRIYDDEEQILQRVQHPPWLALLNLVLDCSFVLQTKDEMEMFFDILDSDLEEIQKTDTYRSSTPDEIVVLLEIAKILHQEWKRGLENIRYHSELSKRIDNLKKAHKCIYPSERKHIRSLISTVDIDGANTLFNQAVSNNDETMGDLKDSIDDIYYSNNKMDTVVDLLKPNQECSTGRNSELREELLEYSVNVPYESLNAELTK